MTAIIHKINGNIHLEIQMHAAWIGLVSGLSAEKMLRGYKTPYLYILRAGENNTDYYVTFIDSELKIRHQPFIITDTIEGWYYENGCGGGPYKESTIDDVIHLIMHCDSDQCVPFIKD